MNSDQAEVIGVRKGRRANLTLVRKSCIFTRNDKRLDLSGLYVEAGYTVHFDGTVGQGASMGSGSIEVDGHIAEREAARTTAGDSDKEFTKRRLQESIVEVEVKCALRPKHVECRELTEKE